MSATSSQIKRPNILLVEDSQMEAKLASDILAQHSSCPEITWAKNGFEALEMVSESHGPEIDMILLDIKMPLMDGIETLKRIRQLSLTSHIPIVMFTSSRLPSDIEKSYNLGANAFIQKQIDYDAQVSSLMCTLTFWLDCNHTA